MQNNNKIILVKYGEMALKGLNKKTFENVLLKNIRRRLKFFGDFRFTTSQSTLRIEPVGENIDIDETAECLTKVFGIANVCVCYSCEKNFDDIAKTTVECLEDILPYVKTFKVEAKRADKKFPMKSPEICDELGGILLEKYPNLEVDVHNPEFTVNVEIRDTKAYVHGQKITGSGGLPVGTSGNGLLLLSGGIDSPVAGYMMAKRGIRISAIHYISPPYTSDRALLKVQRLCDKLTPYCGNIPFFCVPFTKIQVAIRDNCNEDYFTIIMRRIMIKIALEIAKKEDAMALITGESVGQVASQTMEALVCTDSVSNIPVFRPLIGMDKTEIVERARKIDTFDISIEPYEDCCTVFTPRHPKVHPKLEDVIKAESQFDFTELINEAIEKTTLKVFKYGKDNFEDI